MRIAMLTNNYKPFVGGVPISIERLSKGLREQGHEVYIFAPEYEDQEEEEFVIRYKSCKRKLDGGITIPNIFDAEIEEKFRELCIDVIHVHHPMLIGYTALYLGKKYHIPVTYTYHTRYEQYLHYFKPYGTLKKRCEKEMIPGLRQMEEAILSYSEEVLFPGYMRWFANACDLVFAPTEQMKRVLALQRANTQIELLATGLENIAYQREEEKIQRIRNMAFNKGIEQRYLFVTTARLAKEKNLDFLIQSMKLVKEQIGPAFQLFILGEGPEREHLEGLIYKHGLMEEIVLAGNIPNEEIKHYCGAADFFLFSSKSETQGIVLLEAMAAKTPVLAVEASGVSDLVVDGENGYSVREDEQEFAQKLLWLLKSPKEIKKLREGAYKTAKGYQTDEIAKKAELGYREAIAIKNCRTGMSMLREWKLQRYFHDFN